jgi:hypothetical protein
MHEEPQSVWKTPVKGLSKFAFVIAVSTLGLFVIIFCLGMISAKTESLTANIVQAFALSLILVLAAALILLLLRWLGRWKNLRRLLFALVCVMTAMGLFYAEENWRGKRAWENYRHEREAKGEKFDRADFIPPPVPNEQNFAMTPFLAPLFDFKPGTQEHTVTNWNEEFETFKAGGMDFNAPEQTRSNSWARSGKDLGAWYAAFLNRGAAKTNDAVSVEADAPELAAKVLGAMGRANPILEEIRAASHRPRARFNIRYENDDPAAILLPHLAVLKQMTLVLQLRASAKLTLGQTNEAMEDINLMFYLMGAIHKEPVLISQLVRFAQLQLILQPIAQGLEAHQWSDAQLRSFQEKFEALNFCADTRFAMSAERAFFGGGLLDYFRHLNSRERIRFLDDISQWPGSVKPNSFWPFLYVGAMPTGWYYLEQLNYDRTFQNYLSPLIDAEHQRVNPSLVKQANTGLDRMRSPTHALLQHHLFSTLLLPELPNVTTKTARSQTAANLAAIACACERFRSVHGTYPDSLSGLTPEFMNKIPHDLITGQPLHYRQQPDTSILVYSVGWNETDDGGTIVFKKGTDSPVEPDQGDWVWQLPPRHETEGP